MSESGEKIDVKEKVFCYIIKNLVVRRPYVLFYIT